MKSEFGCDADDQDIVTVNPVGGPGSPPSTSARPIKGDWDGDGLTNIGLQDGVSGGDKQYTFGTYGDTPIIGDWNGDGGAWNTGDTSYVFGQKIDCRFDRVQSLTLSPVWNSRS